MVGSLRQPCRASTLVLEVDILRAQFIGSSPIRHSVPLLLELYYLGTSGRIALCDDFLAPKLCLSH